MELIRSGLGDELELTAGTGAEVGGETGNRALEFLRSVNREIADDSTETAS